MFSFDFHSNNDHSDNPIPDDIKDLVGWDIGPPTQVKNNAYIYNDIANAATIYFKNV